MNLDLKGSFLFIGIEKNVNRKTGEVYHFIGLLQGLDSVKIFGNEESLKMFENIPELSKVDCDISVSVGEKTYINVKSVKKVS